MPNLTSLEGLESLEHIGGSILAYMNTKLESIDGLRSLRFVGRKVNIHNNDNLMHADAFLDSLHEVGDYFQLDYSNGTIDCPSGSGPRLDVNLTIANGDGNSTSFGSWCAISCRFPRDLIEYNTSTCNGSSPVDVCTHMWKCREGDMWNETWSPKCTGL